MAFREGIRSVRIWTISVLVVVILCVGIITQGGKTSAALPAEEKMLAHMVYFTLNDSSQAARDKLVQACQKYLRDHPGVTFFAAGTLAGDMKRDVNVTDFDVSLHMVFRTKADHDRYMTAERHLQFIKENQAGWARVRVFDSYVR